MDTLHREAFDEVLTDFLREFKTEVEINSGSCGEFARSVNGEYLYRGLGIHDVFSTEDFHDGGVGNGLELSVGRWIESIMESFGVSVERFEKFKRKVYAFDQRGYVGYHVFLFDGERYYDAECPEGVECVLDLPFFKIYG